MGMKKLAALVMAIALCLTAVGAMAADLEIGTLEQLKAFRDKVNGGVNFQGKTVVLTANIDLKNEEWTPIGTNANPFNGTFDGQNLTISNLKITGNKSDVGLFGRTNNGHIKNLTLKNAMVSGRLDVGAVAGNPYTSKYTNIKLNGHVEVNGMAYVGGVFGKNVYADITDVVVNVDSSSYVRAVSTENGKAYRTYVGGVIGFMGEGSHTVKNVTSNIAVYGDVCDIGGITGIAHYNNNFVNCKVTGNIFYEGTDPEDATEVGGIAGTWHNQAGTSVNFTGCTFNGTLNGLPDGTEIQGGGLYGAPYNAGNFEDENKASGSLKVNGEEYKKDDDLPQALKPYTYTAPVNNSGVVSLPQTGDNSSLMLWASMLALAAAGFAASRKTRLN